MKRYDDQRLSDIVSAITAIRAHLTRGELSDGLVFDAVRIRLLEIGEAVKAISPALLASEPDIPWKNIAAMRDQLAHRYFDTEHATGRQLLSVARALPCGPDRGRRATRRTALAARRLTAFRGRSARLAQTPPVAAAGPGNPMRTVPSEMIFGLLRALLFLDQLRKPLTCTNA